MDNIIINIFIALGVSVGLNMFFFVFAFIFKSDTFTDITYASTFMITSLIIMIINKVYNTTNILLFAVVCLWSIRLGSFLFIRIRKTKVDHRFDKIRNDFWKFGAFWFIQSITVWIVNMPSYISLANPGGEFKYISLIFLFLAVGFLAFETVADIQKYLWNIKNKGKFINKGLWKISRHPNYFGEYMFWWMLAIFAITNNFKYENLIMFVGPLFIMLILYQITGVRIIERNSLKRFGGDDKYLEYLNKTPCVVPFIGVKGYRDRWGK